MSRGICLLLVVAALIPSSFQQYPLQVLPQTHILPQTFNYPVTPDVTIHGDLPIVVPLLVQRPDLMQPVVLAPQLQQSLQQQLQQPLLQLQLQQPLQQRQLQPSQQQRQQQQQPLQQQQQPLQQQQQPLQQQQQPLQQQQQPLQQQQQPLQQQQQPLQQQQYLSEQTKSFHEFEDDPLLRLQTPISLPPIRTKSSAPYPTELKGHSSSYPTKKDKAPMQDKVTKKPAPTLERTATIAEPEIRPAEVAVAVDSSGWAIGGNLFALPYAPGKPEEALVSLKECKNTEVRVIYWLLYVQLEHERNRLLDIKDPRRHRKHTHRTRLLDDYSDFRGLRWRRGERSSISSGITSGISSDTSSGTSSGIRSSGIRSSGIRSSTSRFL